eukprot:1429906-Rhodomonas_salina.1
MSNADPLHVPTPVLLYVYCARGTGCLVPTCSVVQRCSTTVARADTLSGTEVWRLFGTEVWRLLGTELRRVFCTELRRLFSTGVY